MTEPSSPVVRIVIHGTPATAGSKSAHAVYRGTGAERHFTGRVNVAEQDRSGKKKTWRQAVVDAARAAISCSCPDPECSSLKPGYPLDDALIVRLIFTIAKPASNAKTKRTWPAVKPDLLKYARSTEDALKDAGLWVDDSRIVAYDRLAKVYPGEDPEALPIPGAVISVWRIHDQIGWQRQAVTTAEPDTLFGPTILEGAA
jgi:Holliday junction resolvase RusA-like endonuclease